VNALLTEQQAADQLALCPRTLRKARQRGQLPYVLIGRAVHYTSEAMEQFIANARQTGPSLKQQEFAAYEGDRPSWDWIARLSIYPGRPHRLYFIQAASGHIKIGMAANPELRLAMLQAAHPLPLTLLATCSGGREAELYLHKFFARERVIGEWFEPSERLLAFVKMAVGRP
jgi:hypothetical protein